MSNEYKGYSLFNDVEDKELQAYNRGNIMAVIAIDNQKNGKLNVAATKDLVGYFNQIPSEERGAVYKHMADKLNAEGYRVAKH